ncbi:MAG: glycosyl transferase, partial [Acidimicrobiales bacterium]|nr:glycosyl transferase [Acidimicrobiales bacterium]
MLDLVFGYNGFGRLTGNETGSVVGGGAAGRAGMWGPTGWTRMFNDSWGGQASWLIPAALLFAVVGLVLAGVRNRHDRIRSAVIIWGGWLFVTGAVFSLGEGIIHEYYAVALAPAIGALVGIGSTVLWALRDKWWARGVLAAGVGLTGWWSYELLHRTPDWNSWLRPLVLGAAGVAVIGLLIGRRATALVLGFAAVAALAGPTAYSVATASSSLGGAIPAAGPSVVGGFGPGRGGLPGGRVPGGNVPGGNVPGGNVPGGTFPGGGLPGQGQVPGQGQQGQFPPIITGPNGQNAQTGQRPTLPGGNGGGPGNFLNAGTPSDEVVQFLQDGKNGFTYALATIGANSAAGYQLATDDPVMAIGGFNGT